MKVRFFLGQPNAGLAQLVEHLPCKQDVAGSIPVVGSFKIRQPPRGLKWVMLIVLK